MGRLIAEARRRILGNQLLAQGAGAASAALAAFIVLLLVGSNVLSWAVVAGVPVAAFAIGAWRVRRRLPSRYVVAQIVDARLGLSDAISTAVYFEGAASGSGAEADLLRAQREAAERAAAGGDARTAIPLKMPHGVYAVAVLAVVAASLFALRYGLERRLDLKAPLAAFLPETFPFGHRAEQAANRQRNPKQPPLTPDESGDNVPRDQQPQAEPNQEQPAQNDAQPPSEAAPDAQALTAGKNAKDLPDTQMATDDSSEQNSDNAGKNSDNNQNGEQGDSKKAQNSEPDQGDRQQSGDSDNSGLMDKMKDAFQNLLSRIKSPPPQPGSRQPGQKGQQGRSQSAKQQQGNQGQQQNGKQQGERQEGENGEQAANDPGMQQQKGQGNSDSQQASKQPGSGIGSQNGDKDIKNAEQLEAMGKLTEILGRRSQNLTGEVTVEVQQTSQQLRTSYVNKGAEHTQTGAEISRDEVPVALEPYVQEYFEQVRKQTGTAPVKK